MAMMYHAPDWMDWSNRGHFWAYIDSKEKYRAAEREATFARLRAVAPRKTTIIERALRKIGQ